MPAASITEDGYEIPLDVKAVKRLYRRLMMIGFTVQESSNLIAKLMGLEITEKGWTMKELLYLKFIEDRDEKHPDV